jgi:hypothetical protein
MHSNAAAGSHATSHAVVSHNSRGEVVVRRVPGPARSTVTRGGAQRANGTTGTRTRGGQVTTTRRRNNANGFNDFSNDNSVPGLGFDYSHVAATRPNAANGRHHNRGDGAVLFPFFDGGGYFVPTAPGVIEGAQGEEQAAANTEEDDVDAGEPPARGRSVDRLRARPSLGPPAPQRDVPEYVFVKRDGSVFFAVAYTWEKGALKYVSRDGLRRSVERESLDLDATQHFNEVRGMVFRAPA